ncbi:hypothetical protein [Mucilaginibacter sp.]|uniref:hypothetical protein n=1 Tax=Mucilaginibacter sp. TaxID=1882438 RepID=UPI002ECFC7B2
MYKTIIVLISGAVILCFAAFNNKFPLLTTDTGFFINSAFNRDVSIYNTTWYGLFIAHSSWGKLIWLIVFSQCLILSITLFYAFRYFIKERNYEVPYLAFLFFTTFCMSASVTSSTIDPGVFASITIVSTGLLLFVKSLSRRDFIIIAIIAVISSGMALSNLFTMILITVIYGIRLQLKNRYRTSVAIQTNIKRVLTVLSLAGTTFLLISAVHFCSGGDFNIISLVNVQVPVKESVADMYPNKGPIAKAISEPGSNPDKQKLNYILKSSVNVEIAGYNRTVEQSETFKAIYRWYNTDVRECLITRQFQGWLTFTYLNYAQIISVLACICLFIISVIKNRRSNYGYWLFFISQAILIQILVNALLSNQYNYRLVSQVIWLLPMPVFFYLSGNELIKKIGLN